MKIIRNSLVWFVAGIALAGSMEAALQAAQSHADGGEGLAGFVMELASNPLAFGFLRRHDALIQLAL